MPQVVDAKRDMEDCQLTALSRKMVTSASSRHQPKKFCNLVIGQLCNLTPLTRSKIYQISKLLNYQIY